MGMDAMRTSPAAALLLTALPFLPGDLGGSPTLRPPPRSDGCDQTAYVVHDARWTETFTWVLDVSSVPAYLDADATVRALDEATVSVATARTRCAAATDVRPSPPRALYAGPTQHEANITAAATCFPEQNTDGINVVSFGHLPTDIVAVTCTYTHGGTIWQSDVLLNDRPGLFTLTPEAGCTDSYDLQAVMTHERGHSLGLGHVPAAPTSGALTMSSEMARCDPSPRTLATGDVLGLARLY